MSVQWFEFKTAHATLDDLFGWVRVPFGNVWWIQTRVGEVSDNDVAKRWRERKWPRAMAYLQSSLIDALGYQK
jgi:PhnB protein